MFRKSTRCSSPKESPVCECWFLSEGCLRWTACISKKRLGRNFLHNLLGVHVSGLHNQGHNFKYIVSSTRVYWIVLRGLCAFPQMLDCVEIDLKQNAFWQLMPTSAFSEGSFLPGKEDCIQILFMYRRVRACFELQLILASLHFMTLHVSFIICFCIHSHMQTVVHVQGQVFSFS